MSCQIWVKIQDISIKIGRCQRCCCYTSRILLDYAGVELLDQVKCHMGQGLEAYRQESGVYMNGTCRLVHASA